MDFTMNMVSTVSQDTIDNNALSKEVPSRRGRIETLESSMSSSGTQAIPVTTAVQTPGTGMLIKEKASPSLSTPTDQLPQLAVVIPSHNNELTIGTAVILSKRYAERVIVVDTGSTNSAVEVAEHAGAEVLVPSQPCNRRRVRTSGICNVINDIMCWK